MKACLSTTIVMSVLLAACGAPTASPSPTASAIPPATELAPAPSPSTLPPSPTASPPTETASPPMEAGPTATQGPQTVLIYLIALEDQGVSGKLVGCGDSAVPVQVQIPRTQGVLKAALEALLSVEPQYYGESGLYNALYQSVLQVESVAIKDGKAIVKLSGTLLQGGECDSPRVAAQLEETVLQFSTVKEAEIFINGKPLEEVLSLK